MMMMMMIINGDTSYDDDYTCYDDEDDTFYDDDDTCYDDDDDDGLDRFPFFALSRRKSMRSQSN